MSNYGSGGHAEGTQTTSGLMSHEAALKSVAEEINCVYTLLSSVPVSGDRVEIMAEIRQKLRNAYKIAKECYSG